ncbi:hypothetical protein AB0K15_43220 [Amycolatopsis sp. NPDC049253]|uniref:hypothetical protein n=1 Tax=Amycolatopsis sp. NPDC049253 TaxID=3155274 RepID=UPI00341775FB
MIVVASSRSTRRPLQVTRADRLLTVRGWLADALVEVDPAPPVRVSTVVIDGVSLIVRRRGHPGSDGLSRR